MKISDSLCNQTFEVLKSVLSEIMRETADTGKPLDAKDAQARFAEAILPLCKAEGHPDGTAQYLALGFMEIAELAIEEANIRSTLEALGIDPANCQVVKIAGVRTSRNKAQQAEPSLN